MWGNLLHQDTLATQGNRNTPPAIQVPQKEVPRKEGEEEEEGGLGTGVGMVSG